MSDLDRNKIQQPDFGRPHVVILGAGASLAALPNGDKNGRELPLMWNMVDVLGLGPLLDMAGIREHWDNFEKLYSDLVTSGQHPDLVAEIDRAVFGYFAEMELPDEPTLYDHLVLSLRNKDVIATFNWDPFLVQAMARNGKPMFLPNTLFLHGNTAIGYCMNHKPIRIGWRGHNCPNCRKPFQDSRLLYPVGQKNYSNDPFIAKAWELLQRSLGNAYLLTIFGYSAPVTDVEASVYSRMRGAIRSNGNSKKSRSSTSRRRRSYTVLGSHSSSVIIIKLPRASTNRSSVEALAALVKRCGWG